MRHDVRGREPARPRSRGARRADALARVLPQLLRVGPVADEHELRLRNPVPDGSARLRGARPVLFGAQSRPTQTTVGRSPRPSASAARDRARQQRPRAMMRRRRRSGSRASRLDPVLLDTACARPRSRRGDVAQRPGASLPCERRRRERAREPLRTTRRAAERSSAAAHAAPVGRRTPPWRSASGRARAPRRRRSEQAPVASRNAPGPGSPAGRPVDVPRARGLDPRAEISRSPERRRRPASRARPGRRRGPPRSRLPRRRSAGRRAG